MALDMSIVLFFHLIKIKLIFLNRSPLSSLPRNAEKFFPLFLKIIERFFNHYYFFVFVFFFGARAFHVRIFLIFKK